MGGQERVQDVQRKTVARAAKAVRRHVHRIWIVRVERADSPGLFFCSPADYLGRALSDLDTILAVWEPAASGESVCIRRNVDLK